METGENSREKRGGKGKNRMNVRVGFCVILSLIAAALGLCSVLAYRSNKSIGKSVSLLCAALTSPLLGNLIILLSTGERAALFGWYIYILGVDGILYTLMNFATEYCKGAGNGQKLPVAPSIALAVDCAQLLLNPVFGHAFRLKSVTLVGMPYFTVVPLLGLTAHRVLDYIILMAVALVFAVCAAKTVRIYKERYMVILISLMVVGVWQMISLFSRSSVDFSMISYGVFGLLVYFFAIKYRPLRLLDRLLSELVSDMSEAIYVYDPSGRCIWANAPGISLVGMEDANRLDTVEEHLEKIFGQIRRDKGNWVDNRTFGTGNDARYYTLEKRLASDEYQHIAGSFLIVRDNTEEQKHIQRKLYEANHDTLTTLYTKQYLYARIRTILDENQDTKYDCLFLNVKNFKYLNDMFSTAFGDLVLCRISDWLRASLSSRCVFGRLMGDTFGVLMPSDEFDAEKIEKALSHFTVSDGKVDYRIQLHMGVYTVTEPDLEISIMFDRAHLALSSVGNDYQMCIAYYDKHLRDSILWDQQITAELWQAMAQMQIRPFLQPITNSFGRVVGAEVLARWIHPRHGVLSPGRFIPTFERNGMIVEVDKHMWRCACSILSGWKGLHDDLFLSINISPKDFYYIDVASEFKNLVREFKIDPAKLRIEITETVMMAESKERLETLNELRRAGFIVEMDDFGSGYSSLNLLKDMPVDVLKIDMGFLTDKENTQRAKAIIGTIIKLSEDLDITSLTEGVETQQQFIQLSGMGCKLFQGYYFSKPLPVDEFEQFTFQADPVA